MFMKDAKPDPSFTPQERESTARAAGQVVELTEKDSSRPYNDHTGATRLSDGPDCRQGRDRAPAALVGAHRPNAAE